MARDANEFYDPLVPQAGEIAELYRLAVSDVVGLLLVANRDEALVRQVLAEGHNSAEAKAARHAGKQFDLVAHVKPRLQGIVAGREKPGHKSG